MSSSSNEFEQPWTAGRNKDYSDNINYNVGTTVRFAWYDTVKDVKLLLVQDNHPFDAQGGPDVTIDKSISGTTYEWTVSYEGLDPSYNNVFYLTISGKDGCNSHYFNISDRDISPSSSSKPSPLPTSTTSSTSTPTGSSPDDTADGAPTVTVTSSASSGNSGAGGGLDAGPVAGIAVGVVLGVLALLAGLFWIWKTHKRKAIARGPQELDASSAPSQPTPPQYPPQQAAFLPPELMDQRHYVAADGNVYQYPEEMMSVGGNGAMEGVFEAPGNTKPVYEADGKMVSNRYY